MTNPIGHAEDFFWVARSARHGGYPTRVYHGDPDCDDLLHTVKMPDRRTVPQVQARQLRPCKRCRPSVLPGGTT